MKVMQNLSRGGRSVDVAANLDKEVAKMRQRDLFPFQSSICFRIFAHGGKNFLIGSKIDNSTNMADLGKEVAKRR